MPNTLTKDATVLTLPDDLLWPDEFQWRPVEASRRVSIAGVPITDRGTKVSGRPITLQGGPGYAWVTREDVLTLTEWSQLPGQTFSLLYLGETYDVVFDHTGLPVEATPVVDYADLVDTDFYAVTLRFIET